MIHNLKIKPEFFKAVISGQKTFEIRNNDRDFQAHDFVVLREFDCRTGFTGSQAHTQIKYVSSYNQAPGFVVFGFELLHFKEEFNL